MNRSGALFRLIKSLNPSEKRHFTLLASAYRDSSDYIQIFKALDSLESYNEKQVRQLLKDGYAVNNFSVKKIQLYDLLLRALRNYHEGRSFDFTLKEMMIEASILADKALFDDCYTVLMKAKKLATKYEEWKILLEILHKEYTVIQNLDSIRNPEKEISRLRNDSVRIVKQLNDYGILTHIAMSQRLAMSGRNNKSAALKKLMSNKVLKNEAALDTFRARSLHHFIHSNYQLYKHQYELAEVTLNKQIKLYRMNPRFIVAFPGHYLTALYDLIIVNFRSGRFEKSLQIISQLREVAQASRVRKVTSSRFKLLLLSWVLRIELAIAIKTNTVATTLNRLHDDEEYFLGNADLMNSKKRYETNLAFAACYYEVDENKKAIHFVQNILQDAGSDAYHEVSLNTRILQMIIHYEEGNIDLIDYMFTSLKRMISKWGDYSASQKLLTELAATLAHNKVSKTSHSAFLIKFEKIKKEQVEQSWFDYFDVTDWLRTKLIKADR